MIPRVPARGMGAGRRGRRRRVHVLVADGGFGVGWTSRSGRRPAGRPELPLLAGDTLALPFADAAFERGVLAWTSDARTPPTARPGGERLQLKIGMPDSREAGGEKTRPAKGPGGLRAKFDTFGATCQSSSPAIWLGQCGDLCG